MCGRDAKRRKLLQVLDPEGRYKSKALLPFLGKRVIDWQLDELRLCPYVEDLYVVGLAEEDAPFEYPVHYVPTETTADVPDKLMDGLAYLSSLGKSPHMVVISTSDAPAMQLRSINEFFERLTDYQDYDLVLSLVPEQVIKEWFPQSGRVIARFRDHQVFPGELYALSARAIRTGQAVIHELNRRRREIDRQRQNISVGPITRYLARKPQAWLTLLKFALRRATLEDAERAFSAAFHCRTKAIIIPDAGFGMDMDLPEDYERLEDLVKRTRHLKG
jgi:hypothetical protein